MDRGAWRAAVHGVTESWTRLSTDIRTWGEWTPQDQTREQQEPKARSASCSPKWRHHLTLVDQQPPPSQETQQPPASSSLLFLSPMNHQKVLERSFEDTGPQTPISREEGLLERLPWWPRDTDQRRPGRSRTFSPGAGKTPWRRTRQPSPAFLPGKPQGQRSPVGYVHEAAKSWTWLAD